MPRTKANKTTGKTTDNLNGDIANSTKKDADTGSAEVSGETNAIHELKVKAGPKGRGREKKETAEKTSKKEVAKGRKKGLEDGANNALESTPEKPTKKGRSKLVAAVIAEKQEREDGVDIDNTEVELANNGINDEELSTIPQKSLAPTGQAKKEAAKKTSKKTIVESKGENKVPARGRNKETVEVSIKETEVNPENSNFKRSGKLAKKFTEEKELKAPLVNEKKSAPRGRKRPAAESVATSNDVNDSNSAKGQNNGVENNEVSLETDDNEIKSPKKGRGRQKKETVEKIPKKVSAAKKANPKTSTKELEVIDDKITPAPEKSTPKARVKKLDTDLKAAVDESTTLHSDEKKGKKQKKEKEASTEPKATGKSRKKKEAVTNIEEISVVPAIDTEIEEKASPVDVKKPAQRGRKRAAVVSSAAIADVDDADGAKPAKSKKAGLVNTVISEYNKSDFDLPIGKAYNLKISSWNVAGLRSWINKNGLKFLDFEEPDIFCLQEIKCTIEQLPEEAARIPGYHPYWLCMPGGHAGVAIYSKIMPINVEYGIGDEDFDGTGRIITAEYEKFYLICVYVPNSGRKLVNLEPRMRWEKLFQDFVQKLNARKPIIICGDMNVSHQEIDLANPKTNTRNAGFTKEEREKMTELLALGYVDTFRHLYPKQTGAYTFWTYMGNARARNVGWRLDYFLVSERLTQRVVDNCIRTQCKGSDHCPITLFLNL